MVKNLIIAAILCISSLSGKGNHEKLLKEFLSIYDRVDLQLIALSTEQNFDEVKQRIEFLYKLESRKALPWLNSYHILPDIIKKYDLKVGGEVGVAFGTHSYHLLRNTSLKRLYSIDPYKNFSQEVYPDGMNLNQKDFDVLYEVVKIMLNEFGPRSVLFRETSQEAAHKITEELDFIYIDGNHTYDGVMLDLTLWYDKVRSGGIVSGDDYGVPKHPGVKKAVDEFFASKKITVNLHSEINRFWWIEKP